MYPKFVDSRILIIRPGALGDTILALPLIDTVVKRHPNNRIVFLGSRAYRELVPSGVEFRAIDDAESLWLFSDEPPERDTRLKTAYTVLNNPDNVIRNLRLCGIEQIYHTDAQPVRGEHVVEHIHSGLGLPIPKRRPYLKSSKLVQRKHIVWIHPGSGGPHKCVKLDLLRRIVKGLGLLTGARFVITASDQDAFLTRTEDWTLLLKGAAGRVLMNRSLSELRSELEAALLFIGNDSGIAHFAANLGVPSAVFFNTTDPEQWRPWVSSEQLKIFDLRGAKGPDPEEIAAEITKFVAGIK
jgi:heptosyltransferase III